MEDTLQLSNTFDGLGEIPRDELSPFDTHRTPEDGAQRPQQLGQQQLGLRSPDSPAGTAGQPQHDTGQMPAGTEGNSASGTNSAEKSRSARSDMEDPSLDDFKWHSATTSPTGGGKGEFNQVSKNLAAQLASGGSPGGGESAAQSPGEGGAQSPSGADNTGVYSLPSQGREGGVDSVNEDLMNSTVKEDTFKAATNLPPTGQHQQSNAEGQHQQSDRELTPRDRGMSQEGDHLREPQSARSESASAGAISSEAAGKLEHQDDESLGIGSGEDSARNPFGQMMRADDLAGALAAANASSPLDGGGGAPDALDQDFVDALADPAADDAATKLQASFRGKQAREELQEQQKSATKVQANFRGNKAREELQQQQKSATKVQANFRGNKVRAELAQKSATEVQVEDGGGADPDALDQDFVDALDDPAADDAATKLQASFRGKQAREELQEQQKSATKVQANFRGNKVRAELAQKNATEVQVEDAGEADPDGLDQDFVDALADPAADDAATKLQASFRGKQAREELQEQQKSATKVQANFRGNQVRKEFGKMRTKTLRDGVEEAEAGIEAVDNAEGAGVWQDMEEREDVDALDLNQERKLRTQTSASNDALMDKLNSSLKGMQFLDEGEHENAAPSSSSGASSSAADSSGTNSAALLSGPSSKEKDGAPRSPQQLQPQEPSSSTVSSGDVEVDEEDRNPGADGPQSRISPSRGSPAAADDAAPFGGRRSRSRSPQSSHSGKSTNKSPSPSEQKRASPSESQNLAADITASKRFAEDDDAAAAISPGEPRRSEGADDAIPPGAPGGGDALVSSSGDDSGSGSSEDSDDSSSGSGSDSESESRSEERR